MSKAVGSELGYAWRVFQMKILVVGMADSIHLAKWLSQFLDSAFSFRIVSSSPHRFIHPKLKQLLERPNFSMGWVSRFFSLFLWLVDRIFSDRLRGNLIAREIKSFKPDILHVLEFQNGGYAYLKARELINATPSYKILLTPYGSDISWYQSYPKHLKKIEKLLSLADGLSSECRRDELLAIKYGFKGTLLPRIPAFGSIRLLEVPNPDRSGRNRIAVKGYQNKWGQALVALEALESIAPQLKGLTIEIFSAEGKVISVAKSFQKKTGLTVIIHRKHAMTNDEVLELFSRSQVYVGLSKSDGISASMIEAMSRGAIPIQSDTSCCGEWLDNEIGGYLVKFDQVDVIAEKILKVIHDRDFQVRAAKHNFESLKSKINENDSQKSALATYKLLTSGGT
jgi:glycosyltransferase involved in cell wall biosynthesis